MDTITIPKKVIEKDDLVIIPRKEYEALLSFRKVKEFVPNRAQKLALAKAEDNFHKKKTLSYNELTKRLGFGN